MAEKKTKPSPKPRVAMREQPAIERVGNFSEVALGYTREQAMAEAARCLQCRKPAC
ncbi:dihydropyrimidine dehydrogenase, partial [Desulfocurvibacter africanus]